MTKNLRIIPDSLRLFGLLSLYLLPGALLAQAQTYYGKILHKDQALTRTEVRVEGYRSAQTNDEGIFQVSLPPEIRVVRLGIENKDFVILSPVSGEMVLSPERSRPTLIYVGSREDQAMLYQVLGLQGKAHAGRMNKEEVDAVWKGYFQTGRDLLQQAKTFQEEGGERFLEADARFREAEEKLTEVEQALASLQLVQSRKDEEHRQQSYEMLTRLTDQFVSRLLDVQDLLKLKAGAILDMDQVAFELGQKAAAYSEARDSLNMNRKALEDRVQTYWRDSLLTREVRDLYALAIDDIHQGYMLPFNDKLLQDINRYIRRERGRRNRADLLNDMELLSANLHRKLQVLDRNKESVYRQLLNP